MYTPESYLLTGYLVVALINKSLLSVPNLRHYYSFSIFPPNFLHTSSLLQLTASSAKIQENPCHSKQNKFIFTMKRFSYLHLDSSFFSLQRPALEVVMLSEVCSENADLSFTAAWFLLSSPFDLCLAMLHSHTSILMPVDSQIAVHTPIN